MIKIKNFHGVVQSSNMFEAGLKHVKLWQVNQQIYLGLIFKRNLEKIQLFVSIRLYLVFDFNAGTNNFCQFLYLKLSTEILLQELSMSESV